MDWNSPISWLKAIRFLVTYKPDVVILQWWTSATMHMQLLIALVSRLCLKANLIVQLHEVAEPLEMGSLPIRLLSKRISSVIMALADGYTTHSRAVAAEAIDKYHLNSENVFTIPFGVYDSYGPSLPMQEARAELKIEQEFVVLYFGMIRRYKGVSELLQAFNGLPPSVARTTSLIIAGEDWGDDPDVRRLVKTSPHRDNIVFRPDYVPNALVPKYFSAADVVALPYLTTSGSGVASIGMAYGKAILASDLEVMRELLDGYEGATFAKPGDPVNLRSRIEQLSIERCRGELGPYPPPHATWDDVVAQYDSIFALLKHGGQEVSA